MQEETLDSWLKAKFGSPWMDEFLQGARGVTPKANEGYPKWRIQFDHVGSKNIRAAVELIRNAAEITRKSLAAEGISGDLRASPSVNKGGDISITLPVRTLELMSEENSKIILHSLQRLDAEEQRNRLITRSLRNALQRFPDTGVQFTSHDPFLPAGSPKSNESGWVISVETKPVKKSGFVNALHETGEAFLTLNSQEYNRARGVAVSIFGDDSIMKQPESWRYMNGKVIFAISREGAEAVIARHPLPRAQEVPVRAEPQEMQPQISFEPSFAQRLLSRPIGQALRKA